MSCERGIFGGQGRLAIIGRGLVAWIGRAAGDAAGAWAVFWALGCNCMEEPIYAAVWWVWYGLCIAMNLMARERMADMTTVASGAHGHPEVDTMQDLMAQLVDGQTNMMSAITTLTENQAKMMSAITALTENQARMQETMSVMQETIAMLHESVDALRASTEALQAATGELARGLAVVQADVALLVARDS